MTHFEACTPDPHQARVDLAGFRALLKEHQYFGEQKVLSYFREHPSLIPFIPASVSGLLRKDRFAQELNLFGSLKCDFAVGDSTSGAYCFIEFEDARPNSIFKPSTRSIREWSPRLEHAFSQVIDWLWQLDDSRHTARFQDIFGTREIQSSSMIVLGRNEALSISDKSRLLHRKSKITVNSSPVIVLTFDDLCDDIEWQVQSLANMQTLQ
ncbi:MAG: Shedu immune nuclease family protein [Verrucomicrobiota bacterium]